MRILTAVCAMLISSTAFAGLYIEPYLGYESGDFKTGPATADIKGTDIGLKLGFDKLGFALGLDYMKGALDVDTTPSVDVDTQDIGVFLQYTFPILFKVSGSYFFSSEMENGNKIEGDGYKLGAGFTGLPFISLNLDMIVINYDKDNANSDRETMMLSVSLPLSF